MIISGKPKTALFRVGTIKKLRPTHIREYEMNTTKRNVFVMFFMALMPIVSYSQNVFQGTTYQPVSTDYSTLQRSFQQQENRSAQAYEKYSELAQLIGEKRQRISNDRETLIWFDENINSMLKDVQSALNVGDYASASNIATRHIGDIYSHTELRCRIQTYDEYLSVVKSIQERSDMTYQQKQEWFAIYPYKFVPIRNNEGHVIGAERWMSIGGPNNTHVIIP